MADWELIVEVLTEEIRVLQRYIEMLEERLAEATKPAMTAAERQRRRREMAKKKHASDDDEAEGGGADKTVRIRGGEGVG